MLKLTMNPIEYLVIMGNLVLILSVIPQILTQIKSRSRLGFSPLMPWFWIIGNILMIIYNIIAVKDPYLIFFFSFNTCTALLVLYLYYFRSK